jgi:hypothetical protein
MNLGFNEVNKDISTNITLEEAEIVTSSPHFCL